jgi:cobalt/nickel transport system ATP-binding protein
MKAIEIINLKYAFSDGTFALKGIDLEVEEGETVGIIGPNGSGKTTLLLNIIGILEGEGEIFILGEKLNKKNINFIRRKVQMVFQNPDEQLFMPTVFDDVAFGPLNLELPDEAVIEKVNNALEFVRLLEKKNKMPHHLSMGEKKRIAIAGVLAMNPQIILLDEPTSNLDPEMRENLITLLKQIPNTKIIASHDLDMIYTLCTKIYFLKEGQITQLHHNPSLHLRGV